MTHPTLQQASLRTVGTAVQLAAKALAGEPAPYCPDWAVTHFEPTGDREFPWRVEGINLNCAPGTYGHRFRDRIPWFDWRYRFELCSAWDPHFTVLVPWSDRPTPWHPTERTGPFAVLQRGAFSSTDAAHRWARENLAGEAYRVVLCSYDVDSGCSYSDVTETRGLS